MHKPGRARSRARTTDSGAVRPGRGLWARAEPSGCSRSRRRQGQGAGRRRRGGRLCSCRSAERGRDAPQLGPEARGAGRGTRPGRGRTGAGCSRGASPGRGPPTARGVRGVAPGLRRRRRSAASGGSEPSGRAIEARGRRALRRADRPTDGLSPPAARAVRDEGRGLCDRARPGGGALTSRRRGLQAVAAPAAAPGWSRADAATAGRAALFSPVVLLAQPPSFRFSHSSPAFAISVLTLCLGSPPGLAALPLPAPEAFVSRKGTASWLPGLLPAEPPSAGCAVPKSRPGGARPRSRAASRRKALGPAERRVLCAGGARAPTRPTRPEAGRAGQQRGARRGGEGE